MRSFRTYSTAQGVIAINSTCHGIALLPDVPDYLHIQPVESTSTPGYVPGIYPLDLQRSGGGELIRLSNSGTKYFDGPMLVEQAAIATPVGYGELPQGRYCWQVVLLDAGETFQHSPGVRRHMFQALMSQAKLYPGTPAGVIDGTDPMGGANPFGAGFDIHPYTESLRFNFYVQGATTIPAVNATLWVFTNYTDAGDSYGWSLWDKLPLTGPCTYVRRDLPLGSHVCIMLDAAPPVGVDIIPSVGATLRMP